MNSKAIVARTSAAMAITGSQSLPARDSLAVVTGLSPVAGAVDGLDAPGFSGLGDGAGLAAAPGSIHCVRNAKPGRSPCSPTRCSGRGRRR